MIDYKKNNRCSRCETLYPKELVWCLDCGIRLRRSSHFNRKRKSQLAAQKERKQQNITMVRKK